MRAFTLIEVLITLTLVGLFLSTISFSFFRSSDSISQLSGQARALSEDAILIWDLHRKLIGATDIYINKEGVFMITSSGSYYAGVVKCAYIYKDGWLYYYEFPYPYGDIAFYERDRLVRLRPLRSFKVSAISSDGSSLEDFRGIPRAIEVKIDQDKILIGL
ncbi:MAG: prepilin-type N-terminal cleavage/methylation domain-containing protein [Aquificaceae bacterium]